MTSSAEKHIVNAKRRFTASLLVGVSFLSYLTWSEKENPIPTASQISDCAKAIGHHAVTHDDRPQPECGGQLSYLFDNQPITADQFTAQATADYGSGNSSQLDDFIIIGALSGGLTGISYFGYSALSTEWANRRLSKN